MSKLSEQARDAAAAKAKRYVTTDPHAKVDASSWTPCEPMNADSQTGMRVISRRAFRRGGKVHGETKHHMGRKARAKGGGLVDDYVNVDMKKANQLRDGTKHVGALKTGGRVGKMGGGPMLAMRPGLQRPGMAATAPRQMPMMRASGGKVHGASCSCAKCSGGRVHKASGGKTVNENDGTRPTGGRIPRANGGRAKKGTNINIIIAPQGGGAKPPTPPMPPPGAGPVGMHQAPPPVAPPGAAPPMGPAPMMRKSGGRAYPIKDGAGGGEGRLQKARSYGP